MKPGRVRRDGSIGNANGELTVHLGPNWRIEGKRSIVCGSDDGKHAIEKGLQRLIGSLIVDASTFGRLRELELNTTDHTLTTFSLWKGQPLWDIGRAESGLHMFSKFGKIRFDGPRT